MRLASIKINEYEVAALVTEDGILPISTINQTLGKAWSTSVHEILQMDQLDEIKDWYRSYCCELVTTFAHELIHRDQVEYGPLLRVPGKVWGIGLNYVDHACDLSENTPKVLPGSFSKFSTTIIGPGDVVEIPKRSIKTTGEAELAVIYGKKCKAIDLSDWLSVVAGFTTVIDMTAEDILRLNPRYLTQAKNFDTFLSLGSILVTPDEIEDISALKVSTVLNGEVYAENVVSNMTFPPDFLIAYHTEIATMMPGDIILTGTPRAVQINDGDRIECRVGGFETISNPVKDLKI